MRDEIIVVELADDALGFNELFLVLVEPTRALGTVECAVSVEQAIEMVDVAALAVELVGRDWRKSKAVGLIGPCVNDGLCLGELFPCYLFAVDSITLRRK